MGLSLYLRMLVMCCFNLNILTNSYSSMQPLCHEDESSTLLQLKHSFVLKKFASINPSAYPKVESWKLDGSTNDCCSWDGVECDQDTGHVIGLDLSSSFLHGSINSSSSLFNLVHLRRLNLADNDFNSSHIPTRIGSFPRLRSLNLSNSLFSGQIPWEISSLSKLVFLDLSRNIDRYSDDRLLKLEKPSLRDLVQNLTHLKLLDLGEVNISSKLPSVFSNRSSLTHLILRSCLLNGEFPMAILHLPNLQSLNVGENKDLTGYLPEFHHSSRLKSLRVWTTSFFGALPSSIGNLKSLIRLDLYDCNFSGTIPDSVGNLTDLSHLNIRSNKLVGRIPSVLGNLKELVFLSLVDNNLSGKLELDIFLKLPHLTSLQLSDINLTVPATNNTNATLPKFTVLGLASCNLGEFPDFLHFQNELEVLFFSDNQIHGQIPLWFWNITKENMLLVDLSENFLTGFEKSPDLIPWQSLILLELSFNRLEGSLPVPSPSIGHYHVGNNLLSGEISPSLCRSSFLSILVLSYNKLNGTIPQCLANSSEALSILDLRSNNFHGIIPQTFANGIKVIDLSENQLLGQVPPSLANCTTLQSLILGNNHIEGTFPFLLGALPDLQVLILRSNKFHGVIENPEVNLAFPELRIIDLSHNGFSGNLPSNCFKNWNAMKMEKLGNLTYMEANVSSGMRSTMVSISYIYKMTIAQKGTLRVYEKIQSAFVAIDLSNNKFSGEIPESLGSLKGLQVLNISNNNLTGSIPSSLASLTALESLDLSRNVLSGKIPQQLIQLTFLAVLNVADNHLTGRIPRGKQFDTFENSSYHGNPGLCGVPLSISCENPKAVPPPPRHSSQKDETGFTSGIYWMVIFMGYGSGLIVGLVIGTTLTQRYHEWFVETFGRKKKIQKKQKRRERRN